MKFLQQMYVSIFIISLCITPSTTYAISESAATYLPLCGGIAAGTVAGGISHFIIKKPSVTTLVSLAAGGITWGALYLHLSKLTPKNKITAALKLLQAVGSDSLLQQKFTTMKAFEIYSNDCFGIKGSVLNQISKIQTDCEGILSLLQQAIKESEDATIVATAKNLTERTNALIQSLNIINTWATLRDIKVNLQNIEVSPFLAYDSIINQNAFITRVSPHDFPLVIACNKATTLKNTIQNHLQTIDHILSDASTKDSPGIATTCEELKARESLLLNTINNTINSLLSHKDYRLQYLLYTKQQQEKELQQLNSEITRLKSQVSSLSNVINQQKQQLDTMRWR